jgi:hypothetical protein
MSQSKDDVLVRRLHDRNLSHPVGYPGDGINSMRGAARQVSEMLPAGKE